jgi:hypothetical protein
MLSAGELDQVGLSWIFSVGRGPKQGLNEESKKAGTTTFPDWFFLRS